MRNPISTLVDYLNIKDKAQRHNVDDFLNLETNTV